MTTIQKDTEKARIRASTAYDEARNLYGIDPGDTAYFRRVADIAEETGSVCATIDALIKDDDESGYINDKSLARKATSEAVDAIKAEADQLRLKIEALHESAPNGAVADALHDAAACFHEMQDCLAAVDMELEEFEG